MPREVTGKIQLTPPIFIAIMVIVENTMTKKEFKKIDNKGHEEIWEWDETPEVTAAVARLHDDIRKLEAKAPDYGVGK